jgi:Histidine phosphatase superfamily (branch 1)
MDGYVEFEDIRIPYEKFKDVFKIEEINKDYDITSLPLYIVRHGEAYHNLDSFFRPVRQLINYNTELTKYGIDQAKEAGTALSALLSLNNEYLGFIGASDLLRSQQTAFHMMSVIVPKNDGLKIIVVPCIHEVTSKASKQFEQCDETLTYTDFSKENRLWSLKHIKQSIGTYVNEEEVSVEVFPDWSFYQSFYNTFGRKGRLKNDGLERGICQSFYNLFLAVHHAHLYNHREARSAFKNSITEIWKSKLNPPKLNPPKKSDLKPVVFSLNQRDTVSPPEVTPRKTRKKKSWQRFFT